ncbi:MAG: hypothetical protein JJ902_22655 [Roseibium sp.]|nr:hypothetical protein [Roseibium sp.]
MNRAERRTDNGKKLRDRLTAEGRHADAQIVAELIRSLAAARGTCKQLHADNRALRGSGS